MNSDLLLNSSVLDSLGYNSINNNLSYNNFMLNESLGQIPTTIPPQVTDYDDDDYYLELSRCDPRNIYFNCSVEEYLLYQRGPQTLPLETALPVTIFFLGIFVSGILGNVLICIVIIRNSNMHTATNYYLFSLAVSDLIFLMCGLPYEISIYWHQYPYNLGLGFCKIRALISEASTYVSVLTIVAFSMERFLAICHPLHLYTMSGFKRAIRIIAVLWIVSFLSAVPFGIYTKIDYLMYPLDNSTIPESAFCGMLDNPDGFPLWELSTCIFFAVPMLVIMVLYGRMGMRIRSRTRHTVALGVQQGSMHGESRQSQSRKAIIRMLAAVVITFFVCWAPFHAQRLLYLYARAWDCYQELNSYLFSVAGWLYYVSCTLNPILYNVMSHRYRVAFRETLCGRRRNYYQNNGFCRDQSSFRETTITGGGGYESSHLIRVRSVVPSSKYSRKVKGDRLSGAVERTGTGGGGSIKWKGDTIKSETLKTNDNAVDEHHKTSSASTTTTSTTTPIPSDVVVVIGNSINGRPKCFTTVGNTSGNNVSNGNTHIETNEETNENNLNIKPGKDETCI